MIRHTHAATFGRAQCRALALERIEALLRRSFAERHLTHIINLVSGSRFIVFNILWILIKKVTI